MKKGVVYFVYVKIIGNMYVYVCVGGWFLIMFKYIN